MKIFLFIIFLIFPLYGSAHTIELDDKTAEEIINSRMKIMSNVNNLVKKIYKQLNTSDFDLLEKKTLELKHSAKEFKKLFPENSKGGKAKNSIWDDKILFDEYNDNFIDDINLMLIDIDDKNIISLKENFNKMSSNCGACHKKFKNKK